jgi:hypothetical protein
MPFFDSLARSGLLFEDAVAQAPWTSASMASLWTSRNPSEVGGVVQRSKAESRAIDTRPQIVLNALQPKDGGTMSDRPARVFWLPRPKLEALLEAFPDGLQVGILGMTNATAGRVIRVLAEQDRQREKIPVEERDRIDYIVHLGGMDPVHGLDGMSTWLSVGPESPLYPGLRGLHAERTVKKPFGRTMRHPPRFARP